MSLNNLFTQCLFHLVIEHRLKINSQLIHNAYSASFLLINQCNFLKCFNIIIFMAITFNCCFMFNFVFSADFLNGIMGFCCCFYLVYLLQIFPKHCLHSSFKIKAYKPFQTQEKNPKGYKQILFYSLKNRNISKNIST